MSLPCEKGEFEHLQLSHLEVMDKERHKDGTVGVPGEAMGECCHHCCLSHWGGVLHGELFEWIQGLKEERKMTTSSKGSRLTVMCCGGCLNLTVTADFSMEKTDVFLDMIPNLWHICGVLDDFHTIAKLVVGGLTIEEDARGSHGRMG